MSKKVFPWIASLVLASVPGSIQSAHSAPPIQELGCSVLIDAYEIEWNESSEKELWDQWTAFRRDLITHAHTFNDATNAFLKTLTDRDWETLRLFNDGKLKDLALAHSVLRSRTLLFDSSKHQWEQAVESSPQKLAWCELRQDIPMVQDDRGHYLQATADGLTDKPELCVGGYSGNDFWINPLSIAKKKADGKYPHFGGVHIVAVGGSYARNLELVPTYMKGKMTWAFPLVFGPDASSLSKQALRDRTVNFVPRATEVADASKPKTDKSTFIKTRLRQSKAHECLAGLSKRLASQPQSVASNFDSDKAAEAYRNHLKSVELSGRAGSAR